MLPQAVVWALPFWGWELDTKFLFPFHLWKSPVQDTWSSCRHHITTNWQATACDNSLSVKTARSTLQSSSNNSAGQ